MLVPNHIDFKGLSFNSVEGLFLASEIFSEASHRLLKLCMLETCYKEKQKQKNVKIFRLLHPIPKFYTSFLHLCRILAYMLHNPLCRILVEKSPRGNGLWAPAPATYEAWFCSCLLKGHFHASSFPQMSILSRMFPARLPAFLIRKLQWLNTSQDNDIGEGIASFFPLPDGPCRNTCLHSWSRL